MILADLSFPYKSITEKVILKYLEFICENILILALYQFLC